MKTKKIDNKLNLNKATISNLQAPEMNSVHGGLSTLKYSCCDSCLKCVAEKTQSECVCVPTM